MVDISLFFSFVFLHKLEQFSYRLVQFSIAVFLFSRGMWMYCIKMEDVINALYLNDTRYSQELQDTILK
jgi:hypothetical protein